MPTNPTIDAYNRYAQIYDQEVIEFWDNFPKDFIDNFTKHLPDKRVLNVGSGSGRDALLLQKQGLNVVCQDGSDAMISVTTKLGFESHLAAFSEIDFPAASFDGIWAYTSLIHIPKEEAELVIEKLRTIVKPNGTFAIGVIQGKEAAIKTRSTMPGAERYFKNYTSQELITMIEPLGFKMVYESTYQPHNKVYLNQIYTVV